MPEPKDHTLHLLREMRDENREFRKEMHERFDGMEARLDRTDKERREQLDRIESAVAGMSYYQASERGEVATEIEDIKTRLDRIENVIEGGRTDG